MLAPARIAVALIRAYQRYVAPWKGPTCRFIPSCSQYAVEAIQRYGLARGGTMALRRLLRCHPWGGWGYDPVPPARAGASSRKGGR